MMLLAKIELALIWLGVWNAPYHWSITKKSPDGDYAYDYYFVKYNDKYLWWHTNKNNYLTETNWIGYPMHSCSESEAKNLIKAIQKWWVSA